MKGKWILVVVLGALALLLCAQAAAQQDGGDTPPPSSLYPKVQIIDLERDIINAAPETPAMTPIQARREKHLKSLIRLRENFKNRVLASVKVL